MFVAISAVLGACLVLSLYVNYLHGRRWHRMPDGWVNTADLGERNSTRIFAALYANKEEWLKELAARSKERASLQQGIYSLWAPWAMLVNAAAALYRFKTREYQRGQIEKAVWRAGEKDEEKLKEMKRQCDDYWKKLRESILEIQDLKRELTARGWIESKTPPLIGDTRVGVRGHTAVMAMADEKAFGK
jgi:hypothetical protein